MILSALTHTILSEWLYPLSRPIKLIGFIFRRFIYSLLLAASLHIVFPQLSSFRISALANSITYHQSILLGLTLAIIGGIIFKDIPKRYCKRILITHTIDTPSIILLCTFINIAWIIPLITSYLDTWVSLPLSTSLIKTARFCIYTGASTLMIATFCNWFTKTVLFSKPYKEPEDIFDRNKFIEETLNKIKGYISDDKTETTSHYQNAPVIWLNGKWGEGKTFVNQKLIKGLKDHSFLKEIKRTNKHVNHIIPIYLKPTDYIITDNNIEKIALSIYDDISSQVNSEIWLPEITRKLRKYGNVISQEIQKNWQPFENYSEPEHLKILISKILIDNGIYLVIFYDDIDRLCPKEISLFLKFIRMASSFENTISIISSPYEETANTLSHEQYSSDYLDKFYDTCTDLPYIALDNKIEYVLKIMGPYIDNMNSEAEELRTTAIYHRQPLEKMLSIRNMKKLQQKLEDWAIRINDVNFSNLFTIKLIEIYRPNIPAILIKHKDTLVGGSFISGLISDEEKSEKIKKLKEELKQGGGEETLQILEKLFSKLNPGNITNTEPLPKEIRHPEYFNRYFSMDWIYNEMTSSEMNETLNLFKDSDYPPVLDKFQHTQLSWFFRKVKYEPEIYVSDNQTKSKISKYLVKCLANNIDPFFSGSFIAEPVDFITGDANLDKQTIELMFEKSFDANGNERRSFKNDDYSLLFRTCDYMNYCYWAYKRNYEGTSFNEEYLKSITELIIDQFNKLIDEGKFDIFNNYSSLNIVERIRIFHYYYNVLHRMEKEYYQDNPNPIQTKILKSIKAKIMKDETLFMIYTMAFKDNPVFANSIDWKPFDKIIDSSSEKKGVPASKENLLVIKEYFEKNDIQAKEGTNEYNYLYNLKKLITKEAD